MANSTMPVKFGLDIPLLPWPRKSAIFNTKSAITQLVQEIRPRILHLVGFFLGTANLMMSVKLCSEDPCCHGNEKLGVLPENLP